jgi:uroporphyrinogen-III synthase
VRKKTILSTAGLPPESLARLAEAGLDCRIVPCIEIKLLTNETHQQPIKELVGQQCSVIFTSANAVEAVVEMLPAGSQPRWKIFCLEGKTAATVQQCLPACTIMATEKDSATLAEHPETAGEQTFHFFCGGSRMDTLPKLLQQRGKTVHEYIVYETILTEPQLDFSPCAALYFSPSAIQSLSAKNDLASIPLHVCIGKSTAAAIPAVLQSSIRIAEKHSKESVIAALLETIKNNPDNIC